MFKSCPKKPQSSRVSFFTMMELIAVITITSILLTIGMRAMKTDSTSANSQVIGSTLKYAQSKALSLSADDLYDDAGANTPDGIPDAYIKVEITTSGNITMSSHSQQYHTAPDPEYISKETLAAGSNVDADYILGFRSSGEPITATTTTTTSLSSTTTITITDNKNSSNTRTVKVKPFIGKVTYY